MSALSAPETRQHKRRQTHFWQSHLTRKRAFQDSRIYPYPGPQYPRGAGTDEMPHVLKLFPPPKDPITALWTSKKTRAKVEEYERVYPWVFEGEEGVRAPMRFALSVCSVYLYTRKPGVKQIYDDN